MKRIPDSPPLIDPLPNATEGPLFSVMIPTYNCSHYLVETVNSVLQQDMGERWMHIEVVDDCSTDTDVEALIAKIGKGRIGYVRQEQNVGSLRNFETCINRSRGKLVHLLHGDDRVKPGFYAKMKDLFEAFPEAGAAFCRYSFINGKGEEEMEWVKEEENDCILPNWLLRIGEMQRIQYASIVVKREVYEKLGSFYGMSYAEDWEMWVRIARFYPVAYTPDLLAEYRTHSQSLTLVDISNDHLFGHINKAIGIIQTHLPEEKRKVILQKTKRYYARVHITYAQQSWQRTRNKSLVKKQLRESLILSKSPLIIFHVLKLYGRMYLAK